MGRKKHDRLLDFCPHCSRKIDIVLKGSDMIYVEKHKEIRLKVEVKP